MNRIAALLLACLALFALAGCSAFEREYYYEAPYSGDIGPRTDGATEVRNLSMLKTALTNMIMNHTEKGELRFRNYNGSPSEDLAAACFEIKSELPLGAYAVESLSYDTSYVVSYYMANIFITYKRTAEEVSSIVYTDDAAEFARFVQRAVDGSQPRLVIRCYDAGVDEAYVLELVKRHFFDDPVTLIALPLVEVTSYPQDGANRIFDIRFRYSFPAQRLREMSLALANRISEITLEMTETEPAQLALSCAERLSALCASGSADALYAATAYGAMMSGSADSEGYALAYRALCAALGIDCTVVEGSFGTMGGEPHFWNIIELDGAHYHVDVSAFAADPAAAFLRSDDAIWGAYIWDTAAYPACGGELTYALVAGLPEPAVPAAAEAPGGGNPDASQTQTPPRPDETEPPPVSAPPSPEPTDAPPAEGEEPAPSPEENSGKTS